MQKHHKELYLKTSDKIKIAVNHYQTNHEQVVIIANGWTMSKDSKFIRQIADSFAEEFDVVSFDFRGHGKSSGTYTFTGNEVRDLDAVVEYVRPLYKELFLIGFSLGSAISIIYNAYYKNINKFIAVSAPHSFEQIKHWAWAKDFINNPFGKYEPKICVKLRPNPIIRKKIKPVDVVDKIETPTLFIVGDKDKITLLKDTKLLFDKAKCEKSFETFKDCNHAEDLIYQNKEKLMETCMNWLNKI